MASASPHANSCRNHPSSSPSPSSIEDTVDPLISYCILPLLAFSPRFHDPSMPIMFPKQQSSRNRDARAQGQASMHVRLIGGADFPDRHSPLTPIPPTLNGWVFQEGFAGKGTASRGAWVVQELVLVFATIAKLMSRCFETLGGVLPELCHRKTCCLCG